MKKLMIASAVAALASGAFAVQGQVYELTLTAKTTGCAATKVSSGWLTNELGADLDKGSEILYRKQVSRKLVAVLWGCSCDDVFGADGGWENTDGVTRADGTKPWAGSVLFDKKTGELLGDYNVPADEIDNGITFDVLNRIGKKANELEVAWTLTVDEGEIKGAGFGKIKDILDEDNECNDQDSVVSSAKGSFAGYLPAETLFEVIVESDCPYCVEGDEYDVECAPWVYCECVDKSDEDNTVVFGTWSLKYNSSASKKLSKTTYIGQSYKFPKAVAKVVDALEAE